MSRLVLFDDDKARRWRPFSLTRPVGELLFGMHTLRARAEKALGLRCAQHVSSAHLAGFAEDDAPPVAEHPTGDGAAVYLSSRVALTLRQPHLDPGRRALLTVAGEPVGVVAPDGRVDEQALADPTRLRADLAIELHGRVLHDVWDLITANPSQLEEDAAGLTARRPRRLQGAWIVGDGVVHIPRSVEIEPGALLDARHGPIVLSEGVVVRAFTRLAGPAFVGPRTLLLGGPFEGVSIGPRCRVHGEVEESVILGYSNKSHDGFLGHAYLGRWVNLGAMTTNSDLKNNYGTIRLWTPAGEADTGTIKLGCLLGDHVKTAIGTLLNTGTVIEAGSNVFDGMPPKYVPPFSWGNAQAGGYDLTRFLETAQAVMARRDVELTAGMRDVLRRAWELGRAEAR